MGGVVVLCFIAAPLESESRFAVSVTGLVLKIGQRTSFEIVPQGSFVCVCVCVCVVCVCGVCVCV